MHVHSFNLPLLTWHPPPNVIPLSLSVLDMQSLMSVSVAVRKREGGLSRQDKAAARAKAAAADVEAAAHAASAAALAAAAAAGSSGPLITLPFFNSVPYRNAARGFPRRGPSFEGAWCVLGAVFPRLN